MKELTFSKSVAEAMAETIRRARHVWLLRGKLSVEEAYFLMCLMDDLKTVAHISWMESLSNRYARGQHHLDKHTDIDDPQVIEGFAKEISEDMHTFKMMTMESLREPVTEERLRKAEEIIRRCGTNIKLVDPGQIPKDLHQN